MKYHARKHPEPWNCGWWAVFLNDEQISHYQFKEEEARLLAANKQIEQEDIMERVLLGLPMPWDKLEALTGLEPVLTD